MKFFDTHAHLTVSHFGDGVDAVLDRARAAGLGAVTTIGAGGSLEVCREAVALAERHDDVYATVGFHPHHASACDDDSFDEVLRMAQHPKVVGLGETGLDYHYMTSPKDVQQAVFRRFIEAGNALNLPIVIHNRKSDDDCIEILQGAHAERCGGILHCFSSGWPLAKACLDMGFYVSFSGILTFRNAPDVREAACKVPRDRLLVETDSPFLAPVPHRGKQNEPAFVVDTARLLAEARGADLDTLAEARWTNSKAAVAYTHLTLPTNC